MPMKRTTANKPLLRVLSVLLLLALLMGVMACGDGKEEPSPSNQQETLPPVADAPKDEPTVEPTQAPTPTPEPTPEPLRKEIYSVGDAAVELPAVLFYMACDDFDAGSGFPLEEGMKFVRFEVAIRNMGEEPLIISPQRFACFADGEAMDSLNSGDTFFNATLSQGRMATGRVYFTVPVDTELTFVYMINGKMDGPIIKMAYEPGYADGNMLVGRAVTADTLQVGDSAACPNLKVEYLRAFVDSEHLKSKAPKEGFHYVTAEFMVENTSEKDIHLSSGSFHFYADGAYCDEGYSRKDRFGKNVKSGEKMTGTVTFLVPDGAEVLELEYMGQYWKDAPYPVFSVTE